MHATKFEYWKSSNTISYINIDSNASSLILSTKDKECLKTRCEVHRLAMTMTGSSRQLTGHPARVISLLFTCNPFLFLFTKYLQASTNKWIFLCCLHLEPRWDNWENMHEYWEFKENVLPLADLLHLWMCFSYWLKLNIYGSHIYIHLSWHSCFSVRMYTYEFYIQFLLQFTNYWPMQLASRTVQMYNVYHFVKLF